MTSYYVIVLFKLYKEVENDEYISVSNFGDRRMSGFEVIEGCLRGSPGRRKQKQARSQ